MKGGERKKVFVGLSGGVDSSVAALRLKEAGHDVTGVFIKVWHPDFLPCDWEAERLDAMRVAAHLTVPFLTCDAEAAYRDSVAMYFIEEYKAGRTPNPDVMCNKHVKFGAFFDFAREHGAHAIATGHYARVGAENGMPILSRGIDEKKDQSYFLWSIGRELLPHLFFPLGDSTKEEVRREAARHGLPTATKKDSQGICFLGHVDVADFLSHYTDLSEGVVLDESGKRIGSHRGARIYTVGQRHGFVVETSAKNERAHYIVRTDVEQNTITVAAHPPRFSRGTIELTETNWLCAESEIETHNPKGISIQTRYHQMPIPAKLSILSGNRAVLETERETEVPTIGQSCVIYREDRCLGGGIISTFS